MNKVLNIIKEVLTRQNAGLILKGSVKYSALVTDLKGKLGGTIMQGNKAGKGIRTKLYRTFNSNGLIFGDKNAAFTWSGCMADELDINGLVMPDGSYKWNYKTTNVRQNMRKISRAWRTLTIAERNSWNESSASLPKPKNKFGDEYTPSGYQRFMELNLGLISAGVPPVMQRACFTFHFIDDDAQETVTCLVCQDYVVCWYNGDVDPSSPGPSERLVTQGISTSSPEGFLLYYASLPSKPGSTPKNRKLIAIAQFQSGYNSYMLRPILNRFFGKELSGQQILLETVALLSTGAIAQAKKELITIPKPEIGQKVLWSEKAQVFSWSQSTDDVSFPDTNIGHKAFKYFMFYGVDLKPNTAYTIVLTDPTNSYHFTYGDSNNPLDPASLTTDKYGNILPIPVKLQFLPASGGSKSGSLTLTANDGAETVTINFKGTGI